MVTSPPAVTVDVVVIAPPVLMEVRPPITEDPLIVPSVITGLVNVFAVKVAGPASVTIVPELG